MPSNLASAIANGDIKTVSQLLSEGCDPNERGKDGMTPLAIASFWGYKEILNCLLNKGAHVNAANIGTEWTALHCAAFQGHGPVILSLLRKGGDPLAEDSKGRTPADFASAMDAIWPLFSAAGCTRTSHSELLEKKIIFKDTGQSSDRTSKRRIQTSRPGSAYLIQNANYNSHSTLYAAFEGDVLANEISESC